MNAAAPVVAEYNTRMMMAKLGYTSNLDELDSYTAECFLIVAAAIAECNANEMKKMRKK